MPRNSKYLKNPDDVKAKRADVRRHNGGRTRIVTDELKGAMLGVIRTGVDPMMACDAVGVTQSWMKEEIKTNKEWERDVAKAMQMFKIQHLTNIAKHSKHYWAASAWLLERIFPEEYNARVAQVKAEAGKEKSAPTWFGSEIEDAVVVSNDQITEGETEEKFDEVEEVVIKEKPMQPHQKLTDEQAKEIRIEYKKGQRRVKKVSYSMLAKQYGVSKTVISDIINKKTRKNV